MPAHTKLITVILLLTGILMWCGLYAAYHNMQKATLWPDDGFFALYLGEKTISMKLLGTELVVNKEDLSWQSVKENTYYMKDFLANFLNKSYRSNVDKH